MHVCFRKRTPAQEYRGFTLLELIAVIAASALLLSQVVTVTAAARKQSRAISCMNNLAQISRASLAYAASDERELVIPIQARANNMASTYLTYYAYGGKSGIGTLDSPLTDSEWGARKGMSAGSRPLNSILYKTPFREFNVWDPVEEIIKDARLDLDIFHCPQDDSFPGFHFRGWRDSQPQLSSYDYFGTSYTCVPMWVKDACSGEVLINGLYSRTLSEVPNPAKTVSYMENSGRFAAYADNPDYPDQGDIACREYFRELDGVPYVARGWHGQHWNFNATFADGHVDQLFIRSYEVAPLPETSQWCQHGRCECVIVRGPNWQFDTQPARLLPSHHSVTSHKKGPSATGGISLLPNQKPETKGEAEYDVVP